MPRTIARVLAAACVLALIGTVSATHLPPALAAATGLPRATADRVDDLSSPQIHVVYAIPADGADRRRDLDGSLVTSVATFTRWLRLRAEGRALRLDTYRGQLDITFFRSRLEGSDTRRDARLATTLGDELASAGFDAKHKKYAVYWDGPSVATPCGGAAWPPIVPGRAAVMYLQSSCAQPFATFPQFGLGYWEVAMLHDLLHTLGFVATCAPNYNNNPDVRAHVGDNPSDLMWSGKGDWLPNGPNTSVLDVNHDDYYQHRNAACPDLDDSEYLTSPAVPLRRDVPLGPARLVAGANTTAAVRFAHGFSAIEDVCVDVTVEGDPPGPEAITLTVDPALPAVSATLPPLSNLPSRSVSMCLDGPASAEQRAVFGDGEQTMSLTINTGSVKLVSVAVHVLGVLAPTVEIDPPAQIISRIATLSPVRLSAGQTAAGVINLGSGRFSLLDDVCFTIEFGDDLFDKGDELAIELAGTGAPPLLARNETGPSVAHRPRCVPVEFDPIALGVIARGGPLAVAVTATVGSVAITGLRLELIGSRDQP